MTTRTDRQLVRLDDMDFTVASKAEDIRGHKVLDQAGEEVGKIDGLMIDREERKVRFMEVASGGFLGIGEKTFLIPVDAITQIHDDHVHIDRTREHVAGGPDYDPDIMPKDDVWESTYGHYGHTPYWGVGYAFPGVGGLVGVPGNPVRGGAVPR